MAVGEAFVGDQVGAADDRHELGVELVALQHHQRDVAVVLGLVVADQRVGHVAVGERRDRVATVEVRRGHLRGHRPRREAEQRDVHDRGLTGRLAFVQRGGDPAGDGQPAHQVAERRGLHHRLRKLAGQRVGDAAARPEGHAVIAGPVSVGTLWPVTGSADIDDVGVGGANLLDLDAEVFAPARADNW